MLERLGETEGGPEGIYLSSSKEKGHGQGPRGGGAVSLPAPGLPGKRVAMPIILLEGLAPPNFAFYFYRPRTKYFPVEFQV